MFELYFRPRALKILKTLKRKLQLKVNSDLDNLKSERFTSLDIKKIQGTVHGYRLRIGRWRVLFSLFTDEKRIEVVDIFLKKGKEDYNKRKGLLK